MPHEGGFLASRERRRTQFRFRASVAHADPRRPERSPADVEHVLDDEGHFHVDDAPIDLSHYLIEDWLSLGFFWLLGLCVFYQFFTRYVLNDSAAWTEEIARYLLMSTVFVGIAAAVRRTRHIHVDFLYRLLPAAAGRALSTLVDVDAHRVLRASRWA